MGKAKRRQTLDPTYGKFSLLNSESQKEKHVSLILDGLTQHFAIEL